jgi:hypothetical protein
VAFVGLCKAILSILMMPIVVGIGIMMSLFVLLKSIRVFSMFIEIMFLATQQRSLARIDSVVA